VLVATWNINGLRARLDFLLHWLNARKPDVVGLQELKLTDEQFPQLELQAAGYRAVTHGQKSWNGVAVLTRQPATIVQRGLPGRDEDGSRLVTVTIGELSYTSLYVPNGKFVSHEDFPKKLVWLDALVKHLQHAVVPGTLHVVGGDFNVVPEPIDSWNEELLAGHIFHTQEERKLVRALLDAGLCDLFRAKNPELQTFSWWDYRAGAFHKRQGLRIDLLLGTPEVLARTRSVEIDREYRKKKDGLIASDHAPVIADIDL
jgi:exodeoxyribonuclease-3